MEKDIEVNFENIYKTMAEKNRNDDEMNKKLLDENDSSYCCNVCECFTYFCFAFYN